jgi:hypothetical protein
MAAVFSLFRDRPAGKSLQDLLDLEADENPESSLKSGKNSGAVLDRSQQKAFDPRLLASAAGRCYRGREGKSPGHTRPREDPAP